MLQHLKENRLVPWNIRILVNFHASSQNSENLHFDWILLSKAYKDLDEKVQNSYVSWHWRMMQNLKKKVLGSKTLGSKNNIRNLVNFTASSGKSEILRLGALLLSIAYKVSDKKVQKNYLSRHWKKIQTLKKNFFFFFEKWHEEFGEL